MEIHFGVNQGLFLVMGLFLYKFKSDSEALGF